MSDDDLGCEPPEKDSDTVGYGKPPKQHRFKKGKSGNPHGRPKRTEHKVMPVIKMLDEPITIVEGGKRKKVTKEDALVARMFSGAMNGNAADMKNLLYYMRAFGVPEARKKQLAEQEAPKRLIVEYVQGPSPMKTPVRT